MSIFDNIIKRKKVETRLSVILGANQSLKIIGDKLIQDLKDDSTSALCIDLILSAIATMAGHFHDENNKRKYIDLENLIDNPNIRETRFTLLYNLVKDYFNGNAFVRVHEGWIERLNPDYCIIDLVSNTVLYQDRINEQHIPLANIIHIPSRYGYDGVLGKSIFEVFKRVYLRTHNIDDYVQDTYDINGQLQKRLVIDISNTVEAENDEKLLEFKNDFISKYNGAKNATSPLIKLNGIEYTTIDTGVPGKSTSTDLTDNRRFQVEEIARLFNVPKQMLDGSSGWTNEIYIAFIQYAVKPVAEEFAQRFTKLLPLFDRKNHFWEWDYASLERTNTTQQYLNIRERLNYGLATINEIRKELNQPTFENKGADLPLILAGRIPADYETLMSYLLKLKAENIQNELILLRPIGGSDLSNSQLYHQENIGINDNLA